MKKGNEERNSKGDLLNPNPEMVAFIRQSHVGQFQVRIEVFKKVEGENGHFEHLNSFGSEILIQS